jgi:hypothetical protein
MLPLIEFAKPREFSRLTRVLRVKGTDVLLGEEECPLPKSSVATKKSFARLSALSGPISHSYPRWSTM